MDLSLRLRPRSNNAIDKLCGVHAGSAIADSKITLSLGSNASNVARTRQGKSLTAGLRFSSISFFVLFYYDLSLFYYPKKGYTDSAEIQYHRANNY
jgi:hypothetical protein